MEEININAMGEKVGQIVRDRFLAMKKKYPSIGDVRGLGAMMAFELVKNNDPFQPDAELCKKIIGFCAENGLIVINAGLQGNIIRVLSPLVIEDELLKKGLDILEKALEHFSTQVK
jgi:4-aminobutyrate aminotransferase/(S)-3-amino-2-methylpropionate transaminase